jgi:guanylate kinase
VTRKKEKPARTTYLIIVSAPSGAGKTTLCKKLLDDFKTIQLSISSTTRLPRGAEQHGVEYFFLKQEEFKSKIDNGEFAEWAQVHDNYYGTSRAVIEKAFAAGKSVLLDIDVQGAFQLKATYPAHCFCVFITPPTLKELETRLRTRGTENEETLQKRLTNAQREMLESKRFDAVIVNDSLDRAYSELKNLMIQKLGLQMDLKLTKVKSKG